MTEYHQKATMSIQESTISAFHQHDAYVRQRLRLPRIEHCRSTTPTDPIDPITDNANHHSSSSSIYPSNSNNVYSRDFTSFTTPTDHSTQTQFTKRQLFPEDLSLTGNIISQRKPKINSKRSQTYVSLSSLRRRSTPDFSDFPDVNQLSPIPNPRMAISFTAGTPSLNSISPIPEDVGVTSGVVPDSFSPARSSFQYHTFRRFQDPETDLAEDAFEALNSPVNMRLSSASPLKRITFSNEPSVITSPLHRGTYSTGSLRLPQRGEIKSIRSSLKNSRRLSVDLTRHHRSSESSETSKSSESDSPDNIVPRLLANDILSNFKSSILDLFPEKNWFCEACNKPKDECKCFNCCIS